MASCGTPHIHHDLLQTSNSVVQGAMPRPGPLDTGTWHGNPTSAPAQGHDRPQRPHSHTLAWLWANRMRLLVLLATAAGALSLTTSGPSRSFAPHPCDLSDCTGGCAGRVGCRQIGGGSARSADLTTPETGSAHRGNPAGGDSGGAGGVDATHRRRGSRGHSHGTGPHAEASGAGGSSQEPPRSRNVTVRPAQSITPAQESSAAVLHSALVRVRLGLRGRVLLRAAFVSSRRMA